MPATKRERRDVYAAHRAAGARTPEQEMAAEFDALRAAFKVGRKRDASSRVPPVPGLDEAARRVAGLLQQTRREIEMAGRLEGRRA
jgi:hypothetical protein